MAPDQAVEAADVTCLLDVLPADTIRKILVLLAEVPESIVSFSLTCSQALNICSAESLWQSLSSNITNNCPLPLRNCDWSPSAWRSRSYQDMYINLLRPFKSLLQQRLWHTTKMLSGQLLVVDAHPPLIVARSVFYKELQGAPFSWIVFVVLLPDQQPGKAKAYCFNPIVKPPESSRSGDGLYALRRIMSSVIDRCNSKVNHAEPLADFKLHPARLHFLQHTPETSKGACRGPAAAAGGVEDGPGCTSCTEQGVAGLHVCCTSACGLLHMEEYHKKYLCEPYSVLGHAAMQHTVQLPAQPAACRAGTSVGPAAAGAGINGAPSHSSRPDASSSSNRSDSSLPLPAAVEHYRAHWYMRNMTADNYLPAGWRSEATYTPFKPSCWLQPCSVTQEPPPDLMRGAAGAAGSSHGRWGPSSAPGTQSAAVTPGLPFDLTDHPTASVGEAHPAAALTGLWRCTFGMHGVEVLQLQLLQAPTGFDLLQDHGVAADAPPHSVEHCPLGVLLQSVLNTPAPPALVLYHELHCGAQRATGSANQPAVAQAAAADPVDSANSSSQQLEQPQQVLLVGSKVLGDRNMPAGQVSFAVDLDSRSTAGAHERLVLPAGVKNDVRLHQPGTRDLVVKERYAGLAQISAEHFRCPRVLGAELLVFEDDDCMGLMWQSPLNSFSLLSRLPALP